MAGGNTNANKKSATVSGVITPTVVASLVFYFIFGAKLFCESGLCWNGVFSPRRTPAGYHREEESVSLANGVLYPTQKGRQQVVCTEQSSGTDSRTRKRKMESVVALSGSSLSLCGFCQ